MGFSVHGASSRNDDLFRQGQPLNEKEGYLGDTEHISAAGVNQDANPDWQMDGGGNAVVNGWQKAGTNAFDKDVDRDRQMGSQGQNRAAVQLDQTNANQSRGLQMGALGYLRNQANGTAASSAQILGQRANQNAVTQAGQAVTGASGGIGAHLAAQRAASNAALGQAMGTNAQNASTRAAEISRGQSEYASGAQGVEGQDIQAATANATLEAQQRALNEKRQQEFEQRAWNVRDSQQKAADDYRRQQQQAENARNQQRDYESAEDDAALRNTVSVGLAGVSGLGGSDERMKKNINPMGSLGHLARGR